jgi:hypothetical protein
MKYIVISKEKETEFDSLDQAMTYAKTLAEFVTIKSDGFELVGKFGVDSIENGVCPDGVKYDWDKSSRIGKVRNKKEIYRDETEEDY